MLQLLVLLVLEERRNRRGGLGDTAIEFGLESHLETTFFRLKMFALDMHFTRIIILQSHLNLLLLLYSPPQLP
jgi:hypothetical protein